MVDPRKKVLYLIKNPTKSFPILLTVLFIFLVFWGLISTYPAYSKRFWSRSSGSGQSADSIFFNGKLGQVISFSFEVHDNSTFLPDLSVNSGKTKIMEFHDVKSGKDSSLISHTGRNTIRIGWHSSGYLSVYMEVLLSRITVIEFFVTLILGYLFLRFYWNRYLSARIQS